MYDDKPSILGPIVSTISGVLFGISWWIFLDAFYILDAASNLLTWYHFVPLLLVTLGLAVILTAPRRAIYSSPSDAWLDTNMSARRGVFFVGMVLTLSGLATAILFTVMGYNAGRKQVPFVSGSTTMMDGNSPLLLLSASTLLAVLATFMFKFCRPLNKDEDSW